MQRNVWGAGAIDRSLFFMNTKSLVGAVLLGLVFVLVQQIAHRIDALINPACVIIGGVTWATFTGLVVLLYRQPAGIITAEVAAFTGLATGLSILAPFFILANGAGSIVYSLLAELKMGWKDLGALAAIAFYGALPAWWFP